MKTLVYHSLYDSLYFYLKHKRIIEVTPTYMGDRPRTSRSLPGESIDYEEKNRSVWMIVPLG
jgi:hypothetical protein